ncbi:MAG: class I SAM-dependent rRNA methyltransferase [Spirochaetia bacterium]|nr:class I SAM-dependent rRNA methyltransferase [Spirochaetia bacterium]
MNKVILNRAKRIQEGHLWIFSNELAVSPKNFTPGSIVEVFDKKDNYCGTGYINPNSLISIRLLSKNRETIDRNFFKTRIENAFFYRRRVMPDANSFRVVYSEADSLPGLIIDKFENVLSIQFLTLGMETFKNIILDVLEEIFSPLVIILKNDASVRELEGLSLEKKVIKGTLDKLPVIDENGLKFEVNPLEGQKTGYFFDQRENRKAFTALANGGKALDLFSYTGAWAVSLAKKVNNVTLVDSSEPALEKAKVNAKLNGVLEKCEFVKSDVFDFIKNASEFSYEIIVVDPPAFAKNKSNLKQAIWAYRNLNSRAMRLLKPGGFMAVCSCSHHIKKEVFIEIIRAAAKDTNMNFKIVELRSQAKDHPSLLSMPETEYLKCLLLTTV